MNRKFAGKRVLTLGIQEIANGNGMRSILVDRRLSEHFLLALLRPDAHVLLSESLSMCGNVLALLYLVSEVGRESKI